MNAMKLFGLVSAFENLSMSRANTSELSFEDRHRLLVDAEWTELEQRKLSYDDYERPFSAIRHVSGERELRSSLDP